MIRAICFHLFAFTYTAILSLVTAQVSDYANVSDATADRPNILFCISDDQSYAHTGANGDPVVQTPAFDRVAREGLRFTHAFCDAPTCGPSRSAILTGQHIWRLEEAGNIHSTLPAKFTTYTELLAEAGYAVGFTGKGWSPGRLEPGGRTMNPAGVSFQKRKAKPPFKSMSNTDYAGNFQDFLEQVSDDQPFCFWLGTSEPHRAYELGAGKRTGKDPGKVIVPPIFRTTTSSEMTFLIIWLRSKPLTNTSLVPLRCSNPQVNWITPSSSSQVITACPFLEQRRVSTMQARECLLPFAGLLAFVTQVVM